MTAITFGVMQTRVALACGNMPSNDPWYGYLDDHINEAANAVILLSIASNKRNVNLFPELRSRRWSDVTVDAQGYMLKPSTALVIESMTYTKSTTVYNASTDTEYKTREEPDQERFALMDKTATGYPSIWCEASNSILIWPTPSSSPTNYLTQVVFRGLRKEAALSAAGDTYQMNEVFHPVVVDYATYLTMYRMGWHDEAEKILTACEKRLTQSIDILALQNKKNRTRVKIAGAL